MVEPLSLPKGYKRLGAWPIDEDSVFYSKAAMEAYIAGGSSYPGQPVALVDEATNSVALYKVLPDKTYEDAASVSTTVIEAAQADEWNENTDYPALKIVSYLDVNSATEQFQTIAIYVAKQPMAAGVSPEDDQVNWEYKGDQYTAKEVDLAKKIEFRSSLAEIRTLTQEQTERTTTILCKETSKLYTYNPNSTLVDDNFYHICPTWAIEGTGRFESIADFGMNSLIGVFSSADADSTGKVTKTINIGQTAIIAEPLIFAAKSTYNFEKSVVVLTLTNPCIIRRIAYSGVEADFKILNIGGNTEVVTTDDTDLFDANKVDGYAAGDIMSYVNAGSADAKYQTIAVYVAETDISLPDGGTIPTPEETTDWRYEGTEYEKTTGNGASTMVNTETELKQKTGYKVGDVVAVLAGRIFKYVTSSPWGYHASWCLIANDDPTHTNGYWECRYFMETAYTQSFPKKINVSKLINIVYGDDWDGAGFTLDIAEGLFVLNGGTSVAINGLWYSPTKPTLYYRRYSGEIEGIEFNKGSGGSSGLPSTWEADNAAIRSLVTHDAGMDVAAYDSRKWYEFDSISIADDDDDLVLKPNDIDAANQGRWIFKVQLSVKDHTHDLDQVLPNGGNAKKLVIVDDTGNVLGYTNFTYDQLVQLGAIDMTDVNVGEKKIVLVEKDANGNPVLGGAIAQMDKLGSPVLDILLAETANWNGDEITLAGNNLTGGLGENSQEYRIGSDFFLCVSHDYGTTSSNGSATWIRNRGQDALTPGVAHDDSIITELETELGWSSANFKQIDSKSKKGTWYRNVTGGYLFMCLDTNNGWTRIGTPNTTDIEITSVSHPTLTTNLAGHDFATNGMYSESADASNEAAEQGQEWWDTANNSVYRRNMNGFWAKLM